MAIMSGQELLSAAKAGSLDRVSYHLKKGVYPDLRDEEGHTALYWAACRGHSAICRILLLHDADVNSVTNRSGATPLMACADNNQVACMEGLLRQKSIKIDQRSARGDTALHMGAYRGHIAIVRLLIQHHSNPFIQNNLKRTALEEARAQDSAACVEILRHYMDTYKPQFSSNLKVSNLSNKSLVSSRKPTEGHWTTKEVIDMPVHETHTNKENFEAPCSYQSFQSTDSALVLPPKNCAGQHQPWQTQSSVSCYKTPENLQLSIDCSLGYVEGNTYDYQVNGSTFSSKISDTPNGPSLRSHMNPVTSIGVDSQYHSYTSCSLSPNYDNNISLANDTASTSVCVENKRSNDSLFQITSASDQMKSLKSVHGKLCEKYPSRVNDLSCKDSDSVRYDLLPSSKQRLNILPDAKSHVDLNARPNLNHSSEASACGSLRIAGDIQISDFIQKLQMQLFHYESALRKEQQMNCDLQQQIKILREENTKLKVTMQSLQKAYCQRSPSVN